MLAGALLLGALLPSLAQNRGPGLVGDVNGDGRITSADALAVYSFLAGRTLPTAFDVPGRGDANGDGAITRADAELIMRAAVGRADPTSRVGKPIETGTTPASGPMRLTCVASVAGREVRCEVPAALAGDGGTLTYGGQHQYVSLLSDNISVQADTFAFDVRVVNRIVQPIGTRDGTTPDTVKVFFAAGPTNTTANVSGTVQPVNHAGEGQFTGTDPQRFFAYPGILAHQDTSARVRWKLQFGAGVQTFTFFLYVNSPVQFPAGWVDVNPKTTTLAAGGTVQLRDSVRNAVGRVIPGTTSTWASSNPAVATVNSTGLVTAVADGVAEITAASPPRAPGRVTITVSTASADSSRFTAVPDTVAVGDTSVVTLQVRNPSGQPVTQGGAAVVLTTTAGALTPVIDNGDGTYSTKLSSAMVGGVKVSGTLNGSTLLDTARVHFRAGAAARLSMVTQPSPTAQSGVTFAQQPVVQIQDGSGNPVGQAGVTVTAALASGGGTLGGTVTATTDASGTATFTDLSIGGTEGTRTLSFSASGLAGATSNNISVTAGPAAVLAFTVQPSNVVASAPITPAVQVSIQDAFGNLVTTATDNVTLAIGTNPSGGTLSGTTTIAATSGVATFSNLNVNLTGTGYTLAASSGSLTDTSAAFNVTHGPLHHFLVEAAGGGPIGAQLAGTPFNVRVTAQDEYNNTVTSFTGTVGFTSTPPGAITSGGTSGAFVAGVRASHAVTFGTPGGFTLTATNTAGAQSGTSNSFDVQAPPTAVNEGPAANSAPGQPFHAHYSTSGSPQTFNLAAPGVLSNDNLGFPAATITSFGADSLGGSVTTYAAGSTVSPLPGTGRTTGSLSVAADGRVTFTPPDGFTGNYVFRYRLTNVRGTSDGQVTIAVGARPAAVNDTYSPTLVGNVPVNTATSTQFRVTANDQGDSKVLAITGQSNGTATINADSTFTFRPTAGYNGPASFTYTVTNGFGTAPAATVSLTVGTPIWFVNAGAGAGGDGRYDAPFNALPSLAAINNGTGNNPAANDAIFLYAGSYAGPLTLLSGQRLLGQRATQPLSTLAGVTWPADSGPEPAMGSAAALNITAADATAVTLANVGSSSTANNALRGVNFGAVGATGTALAGTSFGTVNISEVGISTDGRALNLSSGTLNGGFAAFTSTGGANNVALANVATSSAVTLGGGTDQLSGATGDAFVVSGTSGSFNFTGNITKSTSTGALLNVSGGHTGTLAFSSGTLSATAGTGLQFSNADGTYTFNGTTTLAGGDAGIDLTNGSDGVFAFAATSAISNPSGVALDVNGGAPELFYNGTITHTAGRAVSVQNITGDSVVVRGSISSGTVGVPTGTGIQVLNNTGGRVVFEGGTKTFFTGSNAAVTLTNNTGATVRFSGGLAITTTSGNGFSATGGGTVTVEGSNNTVSSPNGTAVTVQNTSIGAAGMNFLSVNANGAGAGGIVLANTGAGAFQVTGDGASDLANTTRGRTTARSGGGSIALGSGGTISGRSGDGINLSGTGPVTLRNMVIQNGAADGIDANSVNGLVLDNLLVTGHANNRGVSVASTNGLKIFHSEISSNATTATSGSSALYNLQLVDVTGTDSILSSNLHTSYGFVMRVANSSGTLNLLVQNTNITGATNGIAAGIYPAGSSNVTTNFQSDSIGHSSSRGLQSGTAIGSSAVYNLTVNNTAFRNNFVAIDNAHGSGGSYTFNITNNRLQTNVASSAQGINVNRLGSGSFSGFGLYSGTISGNVIGTAGVANSGSDVGDGINVESNGSGGITRVAVLNNTIREVGQRGIYLAAVDTDIGGGAAPVLEARVQGNSVTNMESTALHGVQALLGALSTDNPTVCLNISGNTVTAPGNGIRVRTSGLPSSTPILRLHSWDGVTAPATYFANLNPAATGSSGNVSYSLGGGSVSSATCTTP
jgi:hypothetical protein